MARLMNSISLCLAIGLLLLVPATGHSQDTGASKQADKPTAKKTAKADSERDRAPRADRPADRPRSDWDRNDTVRSPRPDAAPANAPPIDAFRMGPPGPDGPRGRRLPRELGGERRGPEGLPGIGGGQPRSGFDPGRPMGMGHGLVRPRGRWGPSESADPEMAKLDQADQELARRSMELAAAYRRATPEQRDELHKQLRDAIDKHFTVRQQLRELQLKRLEQQLEQLRAAIEKRASVRAQIIDRHMAELTGEEDPLDF